MPTRYTLQPGYAFHWDGSQEPETVVLPKTVEGISGFTDTATATARIGWVDGAPVAWVDTPIGTFGQLRHFMNPERF